MSSPPSETESPRQGFGCSFIFIGVVGAIFAIVALLGISDRVELEFFGIELNDTKGRLVWLAGCLASVALGVWLLRSEKPPVE